MFGNNEDNNQDQTIKPTTDNAPTGAPEPVADGSLGDDNSSSFGAPSVPSFNNFQPPAPEPEPQAPANLPTPTSTSGNGDDDLLNIKQDALQQLSPLVSHLDQTPEEKFRTTMMMIQAADDQSLIKTAYEAAKQIKDEKDRAQALLDVVNEINYFTQQHNNN